MKLKTKLGRKYIELIYYRTGMLGPEKATEASREIDSLVKNASELALDEAARSLARMIAMGGLEDYDSEYSDTLDYLKSERKRLNAKSTRSRKKK